MPQLGKQHSEKLVLPSSTEDEPAWVLVSRTISVGVSLVIEKLKPEDQIFELMADCMKDWNFTDEDGKKAEITANNIKKMDAMDLLFMREKVDFQAILSRGMSKLKKNSSLRTSMLKQKEAVARKSPTPEPQ